MSGTQPQEVRLVCLNACMNARMRMDRWMDSTLIDAAWRA